MTLRALVRRPSPRLAEGLLTHLDRTPVDPDLALRQWEGYVAALAGEGWDVTEVPAAEDCPDSAFVEDTVVVYDDLAVISRPGALERRARDGRRPSRPWPILGYRIARIEEPGTLDGGDVLKHDGTVWVGLGGRTNRAGVDQLADLLGPLGADVVGVPVSRVLHLKSAVTALPDGTVVGYEPLVDDVDAWEPLPAGARGAGLPRGPPRRGDRPHVQCRTEVAGALRGARTAGGRRRHRGVREARGLRDLPVGAAPSATLLRHAGSPGCPGLPTRV